MAITVEPEGAEDFTVRLRMPGWCEDATVAVNGKRVTATPENGFVSLRRRWEAGDKISLNFAMPVRLFMSPGVRTVAPEPACAAPSP